MHFCDMFSSQCIEGNLILGRAGPFVFQKFDVIRSNRRSHQSNRHQSFRIKPTLNQSPHS